MRNYFDEIQENLDEDETNLKWKMGDRFSKAFKIPENMTPLFAYDYLKCDEEKFGFLHAEFSRDDYQTYFRQVRKLSSKTLNDLIYNHKRSDYFHINLPNSNMLDLLKKCTGVNRLSPEQIPNVGQFHLYTNHESGGKSPRIHFFLGPLGVFYILAFDPFHEIYPMQLT